MIKPKKIQTGDQVAAVTLSWGGAGEIPHRYQQGKKQLEEQFGLKVVEMPNALRDSKWIYENPKARADDLMQAFSDPSIKGIFSIIGGDDSVRILPFIDLSVIRKNPKIFMGYSDTTIIHLACYKAGLTSFYGPAILVEFAENGGMFEYNQEAVRRTLFSNEKIGQIRSHTSGWTVERLEWTAENADKRRMLQPPMPWKLIQGSGTVTGHLLGGCFEVLEFLKGTEFWPSLDQWNDAILFIETSEDMPPPSYCEYWLRNYGAQGILQRLKGILFGRPGGHLLPKENFDKYDAALLKVTREFGLTNLPILTRMDFGHTDPKFILPYGVRAEISCDNASLSILENAVE